MRDATPLRRFMSKQMAVGGRRGASSSGSVLRFIFETLTSDSRDESSPCSTHVSIYEWNSCRRIVISLGHSMIFSSWSAILDVEDCSLRWGFWKICTDGKWKNMFQLNGIILIIELHWRHFTYLCNSNIAVVIRLEILYFSVSFLKNNSKFRFLFI